MSGRPEIPSGYVRSLYSRPYPCEEFAFIYLDRETLKPRYLLVDGTHIYRIVETTMKARIPFDATYCVQLARWERRDPNAPRPAGDDDPAA